MSRADFLRSCGIALLGHRLYFQSFPETQAATTNEFPPSNIRPMETFTAALFQPHVGTEFTFLAAEHTRGSLILTKITQRPVSGNVAQFSLIFQGTAEKTFGGGNCLIHHRALGSLELFIAPIGAPDSRGQKYQACFSRFVSAQRSGDTRDGESAGHVL